MKEKLEPSSQERCLRAFLDIIILQFMSNNSMTAYEIDNLILQKFGGKRSPNVVYTRLSTMERKGLIKFNESRHGRVCSATEKGRNLVGTMPRIIEEIQSFAPIMLGK